MPEWARAKFSDVLDVVHGYAFAGNAMSENLTGKPVIVSIGNFDYHGGFRFGSTRVREFTDDYPEQFVLNAGDLLIAMTCQTPGGEILGLPGLVPDDGRIYLHNQRIGKVLVNADKLDKLFAYYSFLSPAVNKQLVASASGTKILHTAPTRIGAVELDLPPLRYQRAVASVLAALDEKIAVNGQITEIGDSLALTLCSDERWAVRTPLGGIVQHVRNQVSPETLGVDSVAHYSIPAFDSLRLPEKVPPGAIKSSKFRVTDPSVLVSKLNPSTPRVWNVEPSLQIPALASTEFLVLRPLRGITVDELWAACGQPTFAASLTGKVTGTSGSHQRVKPDDVLATEVVDPRRIPGEVRASISAIASRANQARIESSTLSELRDTLLPGLMSGEIRVRDAEQIV